MMSAPLEIYSAANCRGASGATRLSRSVASPAESASVLFISSVPQAPSASSRNVSWFQSVSNIFMGYYRALSVDANNYNRRFEACHRATPIELSRDTNFATPNLSALYTTTIDFMTILVGESIYE